MTSQTRAGTSQRTWSIRTAAAASVLTVVLAAGAGAALAGLGDSTSGRTGFPGPGGLGGFAPGHRFGLGQGQLPPVTRTESGDGLDT
jgi:hypothetical protein